MASHERGATRLSRNQFILRYGVLGFGLGAGILSLLFMKLFYDWSLDLLSIAVNLSLMMLGGLFWGWIMWKWQVSRSTHSTSEGT